MNKISLCQRYPLKNVSLVYSQFFQVQQKSSKKIEENDDENVSNKKQNTEALKKLNLLLKQIVENDAATITSNLKLAKPKPKRNTEKAETKDTKIHSIEPDVVSSAKNVAEFLGGNAKQTELELLSKLLNSDKTDIMNKQSSVTNLSDIVKDMKIDRNIQSVENLSRAQQVRSVLKVSKAPKSIEVTYTKFGKKRSPEVQVFNREKEKIDLFGKDSLGIFSDINQYIESEVNKTWQKLHDRDLRLAVTHPPANYFQQVIQWTEQGKMWKFPIDNEQGMEEENNVSFTEHVFLERHLECWCPSKGPIRHFMELVCIGLSKNPYMSVQCKQEHIKWYKDYFQAKHNLLEEVGAIPSDFKQEDRSAA